MNMMKQLYFLGVQKALKKKIDCVKKAQEIIPQWILYDNNSIYFKIDTSP